MERGIRELAPGDMFAGCRIEVLAGRGGMGLVYKARQARPDRVVAVKVILPEIAGDQEFRARFEQEAALTAEIEHPNVIPIYGVGVEDELLYIVMRFVEGMDLGMLLRSHKRLVPAHAGRIVTQIAAALDAAHDRGLVHRDVKPANVLVTANEHLYLTDFGLTKRVATVGAGGVTALGGLTAPGHFVGTVDYIAPEQVSAAPVDARADVYSLGCILYQLLTGEVPYPNRLDEQKVYAHLAVPPPLPSSMAPEVPPELDAVVARAMAKDVADRHPSAGDLAREVTECVFEAERRASRERGPHRSPPRNRLTRRILIPLLLVGALITAAAAVLGYVTGSAGTRGHAPNKASDTILSTREPSSRYAAQLSSILGLLNATRTSERHDLLAAATSSQQAKVARRLSQAYSRAIEADRGLQASAGDAALNARIIHSMGAIRDAYVALADAATKDRADRYGLATTRVRDGEHRLADDISALRTLGYQIT